MTIRLKHLLTGLFLIALCTQSRAGGFPVRPGSLLVSPTVSYFYASQHWDSAGVKKPFDQNGHFSAITYSIYMEYGLTRRFSLVVLAPYVIDNYQQTGYKSINEGFSDLETGLKYYLANIKYTYYFSLQGTLITPMYNNPNLGFKETGAEFKVSFAGSGHVLGDNCYFTLEDGVRQYWGSGGPLQNRYYATFGLTLDKKYKNQVSVSLGGTYSTSNSTGFSVNEATNKNFAFNQVTLSYGHSFTKRFSVFLNGGQFITGRNTGVGETASVSLILKPF